MQFRASWLRKCGPIRVNPAVNYIIAIPFVLTQGEKILRLDSVQVKTLSKKETAD